MRFRIAIEQRTQVQGSSGEPLDTWNLFASRRAAKVALTGTEQWAAQQQYGRVPTIFSTRYIDGVLPSMRLLEGEKVFEIVSAVDPDGTKTEMTITTLERVGESA
jgi:SPP1 family predicted phage head-tail adaptor